MKFMWVIALFIYFALLAASTTAAFNNTTAVLDKQTAVLTNQTEILTNQTVVLTNHTAGNASSDESDQPIKTSYIVKNSNPSFTEIIKIVEVNGDGNSTGENVRISVGNQLRILGFGRGQFDKENHNSSDDNSTIKEAEIIPSKRHERQVDLSAIPIVGDAAGDGLDNLNITSLLGSGGLSALGLGGGEPDSRFRAPGPRPEDILLFAGPDERPKFDDQGNLVTRMNSRYQVLKGKYLLLDKQQP